MYGNNFNKIKNRNIRDNKKYFYYNNIIKMNSKDFFVYKKDNLSFISQKNIVILRLEIASTQQQKNHGLMERTYLPDRHGMLFIYEENSYPSIWMKNTYIPLDVLFVNKNGTIQCIKTAKPLDETHITCSYDLPSKYVIELPLNTTQIYKIKEGDYIQINSTLSAFDI